MIIWSIVISPTSLPCNIDEGGGHVFFAHNKSLEPGIVPGTEYTLNEHLWDE